MKRKLVVTLMVFSMMFCMVACGKDTAGTKEDAVTESENRKENKNKIAEVGIDGLEEIVISDVEDTVAALSKESEKLIKDVDSYEAYIDNTDKVQAFYEKVCQETDDLCIRLREYSVDCAKVILESDNQPYRHHSFSRVHRTFTAVH